MVVIKSPEEIKKIAKSNRLAAEIISIIKDEVRPGISTRYLNELAEKLTLERKALPAFKGYKGFPYSICTSVNEEVVHGLPTGDPLKIGDILSIDFGINYDGFFGDTAITVPVGQVSKTAERLTRITRDSLYEGISKAVPGGRLSDISNAIQKYVECEGFSVVRQFVGHGIGKELHEDPQIPNWGKPGLGLKLRPGMTLAIEPMVNEKGPGVKILGDGWTAITSDGGLSAHFEHTIAVTEKGPVILSTNDNGI